MRPIWILHQKLKPAGQIIKLYNSWQSLGLGQDPAAPRLLSLFCTSLLNRRASLKHSEAPILTHDMGWLTTGKYSDTHLLARQMAFLGSPRQEAWSLYNWRYLRWRLPVAIRRFDFTDKQMPETAPGHPVHRSSHRHKCAFLTAYGDITRARRLRFSVLFSRKFH